MKTLKLLKTLFVGMVVVSLIVGTCPVYAAPNGKGAEKNQGKGNQGQGQIKGKAVGHARNAEKRKDAINRARKEADIRANRPSETAKIDRGRNAEHKRIREAKVHGKDLFNALDKARWSHNPHDERGQGNMGKPKMRDPYGFDKDSGREGSERGRPIHEVEVPLLNLAEILNIDFTIVDYYLAYLLRLLSMYLAYAQRYPQYTGYADTAAAISSYIDNYRSRYTYDRIAVNRTDSIDYTLTFTPPDGFDGTNLLITTSLISVNDYTSYGWSYNPTTRRWEYSPISYSAGEVVMEQTQEVTLGTDNTLSFSYDPPSDMASYSGFYADLAVTVTEPESGQSYTMDYDRQLYLYRCPYGKVYSKKTGQPVVAAKVTVYFEDGSIVPLDKASNSTASNPQLTDATGRYGFKLATNRKYYLAATASGYKDYKSSVFTEKWHVLREDIALVPIGEKIASNVE